MENTHNVESLDNKKIGDAFEIWVLKKSLKQYHKENVTFFIKYL